MKLVWQLVLLGTLVSVCGSTSLGQNPGGEGRRAGLTLRANVTPASILELSSESNNIQELKTMSTAVRVIRVDRANAETFDLVKQTPAGTLLMTRVEFLVRFSGFKQETATLLITATSVDEDGHQSLIEGSSEESLKSLQPGQTIKIEGVRSGTRIVRYVGFLVDGTVETSENNGAGATLRYELIP